MKWPNHGLDTALDVILGLQKGFLFPAPYHHIAKACLHGSFPYQKEEEKPHSFKRQRESEPESDTSGTLGYQRNLK